MLLCILMLLVVVIVSPLTVRGGDDLFSLEVANIDGKKVSLAEFKDKVLLVVNVASECGYTDLNYKELVKMQTDYKDKGFSILGFPCNQFGEQEPRSNADILSFSNNKYHVNFPLFSKIDVKDRGICDVYSYLYSETAIEPSWNFCKYLIDRGGSVVQFFSEKDSFASIRQSVDYLMHKHIDL